MLTLDKIYHASHVLKNVVRETKLVEAPKINPECEVYLKPECLQLTGSFKLRGSGYMISQLSDEEKAHGGLKPECGGNGKRDSGKRGSHQCLHCKHPPALGLQQVDKRAPQGFDHPREGKPSGV